jgi:NitT/TauT family transport system substrate-binding protein
METSINHSNLRISRIFLYLIVVLSIQHSQLVYAAPDKIVGLPTKSITLATSEGGAMGFLTNVIKILKLDEREGINLDLKYFPATEGEMATLYGKVEVGFFAPISAVRANLENFDLNIFAPIAYNHSAILVPVNSKITTVKELTGKKLGVFPRVSGAYNTFATIISLMGMNLEKDFHLIFGVAPTLIAYLERKDVDAILMYEPLTSKLLATGKVRSIGTLKTMWEDLTGVSLINAGLAAHKKWILTHRDESLKLIKIFRETITYITKHPEIFDREDVKKALDVKTAYEVKLIKKNLPEIYAVEWNKKAIENINFFIQKNIELGLLKSDKGDPFIIID